MTLYNPFPIRGVVTDASSNPIVGATIEVQDLTGYVTTGTTTTIADGFYQIDIQNVASADGDTIEVKAIYGGSQVTDTFSLDVSTGFEEVNLILPYMVLTETVLCGDARSFEHTPLITESGYTVLVDDEGYERVYNVFSVKYDDPSIVLTDVPTFEVETDNITGRNINKYNVGKGCKIYRNRILKFFGIIEPRSFGKSSSGSTMTFGGVHKGYKYLQDRVCDYYRAENNSYAPVVNPWRFGRKTSDEDNTLIDGLRPDEIMRCLIGSKFIWQEWFTNHDFLKFNSPPVGCSGTTTIVAQTTDNGVYSDVRYICASGDYYDEMYGNTFKEDDGCLISSIQVYGLMYGASAGSGTLECEVLSVTSAEEAGQAGEIWPGNCVGVSSAVACSGISTTSPEWVTFEFASPIYIAPNTTYLFLVGCGESVGSSTERVFRIRHATSDQYSDGFRVYAYLFGDDAGKRPDGDSSVVRSEYTSNDLAFKLIGYPLTPPLVVYDDVLKLPKTYDTEDDPDAYETAGGIASVGLYNGDKHVDVMGAISEVTAKLIGTRYSTYNPTLYVCRDADEALPTWSQLTLTYDGDGVWTGSANLSSDGAVIKNQFGYFVSLNSDGDGTTEIDYARFDCVTESDTGVLVGVIDPYNDPNMSDDTIAINLAGISRLEALEKVRGFTNTSTEYADINWDAYINNNLEFFFTTIRGEDVDQAFSFYNRNLTVLNQTYDGKIKNAIIAIGQGEEPYAVAIVGSELKDTASITEYGQRTGYFIDKSIPDAPTLYKRAKAYLKYMKDPRETLEVNICNDPAMEWDVGDRIKIEDVELDIDGYYRVQSRSITKKQDADEEIEIELSTKANTLGGVFRNIQDRFSNQEVITQGTGAPSNTLAAGLVFDTTRPAEYPFYVPENAQRVVVSVKTHKYRAYSKAAAGGSPHSHNITGETTQDTTAGMYAIWTNPKTMLGKTVGANSWGKFMLSTVIPWYEGKLFSTMQVIGSGGTIGRVRYGMGGVSGMIGEYCAIDHADYTNSSEYFDYISLTLTADDYWQEGYWYWVWIYNPTSSSKTYDIYVWGYAEEAHDHDLTGIATTADTTHTHSLTFGIYEFDYYPAQTHLRIDSLTAGALQKFGYIGTESRSAEVIDLDITDDLRDENGKLIEGLHTLYFESQPSTNNPNGLGIISVSHKITVNTAEIDMAPIPEE